MDTLRVRDAGGQTALLYVIAGSLEQAVHFAQSRSVPKGALRCVSRPDHLRGLRGAGQKFYVVGTASRREYFDDCLAKAVERGFSAVYV